MSFNIDSWYWKIAIVLALLATREFVRLISPKEASGVTNESSKWIIETLDSAAIAIGLVLFIIQPFLLQAFYIPSGSMEDTLLGPPPGSDKGGDRLLVSKLIYRLREPQFQDVVVFRAPPESHAVAPNNDFIKRCIGTPGDVVFAFNRKYFRKARGSSEFKQLRESYVKWSPSARLYSYDMKIVAGVIYSREYRQPGVPGLWCVNDIPISASEQQRIEEALPEAVPAGKFLMLGDHRNNSNDSHAWGFVPRENIIGKAICIFWPATRVGLLDHISFRPRTPRPDSPGMVPAS